MAPAALALAALAAYHGSFSGPFVGDDVPAIAANTTLRHFSSAFFPPPATTVSGRPMVNLSLALNYRFGGMRVGGYHALNLAIHILAGLALYGIVRRTVENGKAGSKQKEAADSTLLAFVVALLWTAHPLQTEAVTYIVQRAESLMGMFYLLTVYAFIRYSESSHSETLTRSATSDSRSGTRKRFGPIWAAISVVACLFGMASKEVMVSAPLIVLLYDRTFVAGSFAEAWRRRRNFYLGLAATWILLAYLVAGAGGRGGTAGFGSPMPWRDYAVIQFWAIAHYLRLAVWPSPLVFDYGRTLPVPPVELAVDAIVVLALMAGTVWLLRRRRLGFGGQPIGFRWVGFAGAWFFLILAPSSSVVPVATEIVAEHRMYLPLAAVIAIAICGFDWFLRQAGLRSIHRAALPSLALAGALGWCTAQRNRDYGTELSLWRDTVAKMPGNAVAHNNLGKMLSAQGFFDAAADEFREALREIPDLAEAHNNLGTLRLQARRLPEAIAEFERALRLKPDYAEANYNLGIALASSGRPREAIARYERAIRLNPAYAEACNNLGIAFAAIDELPKAIPKFEQALRLRPDYAEADFNLGLALERSGDLRRAIAHYRRAVASKPDLVEAHFNLGNALMQAGYRSAARAEYETALRLRPDYEEARAKLRDGAEDPRQGSR